MELQQAPPFRAIVEASIGSEVKMMQTDLKTLRDRVFETARMSPVGQRVQDVVLESDRDDEGANFLRVIIQVSHGDKADYAALEALLEAIENEVGAIDERYPSVRFSDAA